MYNQTAAPYYSCLCQNGYSGPYCQYSDCFLSDRVTPVCGQNAICQINPASVSAPYYTCICTGGYQGKFVFS